MASKGAVGFVGLDELSLELATSLLRHGYSVQAFETLCPLMDEFLKLGGTRCAKPKVAGEGVAALIVLISHVDQITDMIFSHEGALRGLHKDAVIILHSTIAPAYLQNLEKSLSEGSETAFVVDAYVSRGVSEDLNGRVMVISSGRSDSIARARPFLSAMCGKSYAFEGDLGAGSKLKMVTELLEGIHFVASLEAIALGVKAGIHPWILYDIISNAAGNSWVFKNHVPQLLRNKQTKQQFLTTSIQNLGIVLDMAKSLTFPLPLLAVAHQQLIAGCLHAWGDNDSTVVKVWENVFGVNITDAANADRYDPEQLAHDICSKSDCVNRIGFIGLGAMGFGMATHLLKSNFCVIGYDVYKPTLSRFGNEGGLIGSSPAEVSRDIDVLVVMVTNEAQAESVLYGDHGAVSVLQPGASIILSSTVSPAYVSQLERRLQIENKNLKLVDAPVSGGVKRASMGTLAIMASGTEEALKHSGSVLSALSEKLYIIKGGCGAGSGVKMVNQLLAGVHIASAAEAMAFGARLRLSTKLLFDAITNTGGTSWMFENRGPHMMENDYTPLSALDIFVKDLGIVTRESSTRRIPLHVCTVAHQLFLAGSAAGWGRLDDAAVVKVYETLTGVKVQGKLPILSKESVFKSLPPEWPMDPIEDIHRLNKDSSKIMIVLDDDPTGTQTVHGIEVLTEWNIESLVEQFTKKPTCFFILTNSRSLSPEKASALIADICRSLSSAAKSVENIDYTVVLRGDSTLRGHFLEEADAVVSVIGEMDAWIICPFFLQGGRYTIGDIHYVADSDRLVPAGETEFAKDAAFGYKSSNLQEWVEEKTRGRIPAGTVTSISIQLIRKGGPDAVCESLCSLQKGSTCIVNAASERDMAVFAAGMIKAELKGKRFLCRTAASFVSARIGIIPKAPILPSELGISRERAGGLIVVGSYVPKTTKQVEELKLQHGHKLRCFEISVEKLSMKSSEEREEQISRTAEMADVFLKGCQDTLIMTSRELITGKTPSESLEINFKVSSALVEIVRRITTRPRYILAKGGITSSDLATKALEAKRAKIVGQAIAGVPLWQLGPESRHPKVPYIVFPGNVGDSKALAEVVKCWSRPDRLSSTQELLFNAEKGGYAIGAFNVYNLEGIQAVVAAAEEEQSPAILQIHPGALKHGGTPLVACCIAAAQEASVPITVHFDHGNSKQQLVEILEFGFDSVMVDGSHLPFNENISYTKCIASLAHSKKMLVEAELGRLSGTEDDLTVEDYEARLTDVNQAREFIHATGIDALAVCIGNVHGKYPVDGPKLRLDLLKELHDLSAKEGVYLVLHGASGLHKELIKDALRHVFASRIAEIRVSPQWNHLSFVSCACNGLVLMDESLQLLPAIETLDLSRNKFTKVDNLLKCTKLKHLDLGFNHLRRIASFGEVSCQIVKLVLRNNALTTLCGLENLKSLEGLDLSYNIISNFLELEALAGFPYLQNLWLEGNPLCCARWYRAQVFSFYPHPDKLKLDDKPICTREFWKRQILIASRQKRPASFGFYSPAKVDAELVGNINTKRKKLSRLVSIESEEQSTCVCSDQESVSCDNEIQSKEENVILDEEAEVVDFMNRLELMKKERSALWLQEFKEWMNKAPPDVVNGGTHDAAMLDPHKENYSKSTGHKNLGETSRYASDSIQASVDGDESSTNVLESDNSFADTSLGFSTHHYFDRMYPKLRHKESCYSEASFSLKARNSHVDSFAVLGGDGISARGSVSPLVAIDDIMESHSSSAGVGSPPHYREDILHRRNNLEEEFLQLSAQSYPVASSESNSSYSEDDSTDQPLLDEFSDRTEDAFPGTGQSIEKKGKYSLHSCAEQNPSGGMESKESDNSYHPGSDVEQDADLLKKKKCKRKHKRRVISLLEENNVDDRREEFSDMLNGHQDICGDGGEDEQGKHVYHDSDQREEVSDMPNGCQDICEDGGENEQGK